MEEGEGGREGGKKEEMHEIREGDKRRERRRRNFTMGFCLTLTHVFDSSGGLLDGLLEDGASELLDKRLVQALESRLDEGEGDVSGCVGRKGGAEGGMAEEVCISIRSALICL